MAKGLSEAQKRGLKFITALLALIGLIQLAKKTNRP
jgi:hypothetical protein